MFEVPLDISYKGKHLDGVACAILTNSERKVPLAFDIYLERRYVGILRCKNNRWVLDRAADADLVEAISNSIHDYYE